MEFMLDSCVLLDVFNEDSIWYDWSASQMALAASKGTIILNAAIYAEISAQFEHIEALEALLNDDAFEYRAIPREAAFLAGKCFSTYRRRGGVKSAPLPDFFIGAHASVEELTLITRDGGRFCDYFPRLTIIRP